MIQVLNAGHVKLLRSMGGDEAIVKGARICFQNEGNPQADENLIKMLVREKHTSPMEHCVMTFNVKLPLFVRDQWVRHRIGMSYNIMSLRYCEANPEFFVPSEFNYGTQEYFDWIVESRTTFNNYLKWIERFEAMGMRKGRARELARTKIPTEIYTEMNVTMNGASCLHFLDLRDDKHSQPEMQQYGKAVLMLAKRVAPVTFGYYEQLKYGGLK